MSKTPAAFKVLTLVAITGFIASLGAFVLVSSLRGQRATSNSGLSAPEVPQPQDFASLRVPEFEFTDHNGSTADQALFENQVTILDFFFTSCPLACPGMTAKMKGLAKTLDGLPIRFVSVSVDGATDTPERLRDYAAKNELDLDRWTLLTGSQEGVQAMLEEGLGMTIRVDDTNRFPVEGGGETLNVIHPTRLLLIRPDRGVEYAASYTRQNEIELLVERARALADGEG
ncbi:MAG: SCO family protein [Planctomycetota bacterium]